MYIYVHVPFCVSRCVYCDFYVTLEKYGGQEAFVDALCREIGLRFSQEKLAGEMIQTLYVGGGTPSLLSPAQYRRIFDRFREFLPFADDAEVTFEANPGGRKETLKGTPEEYLAAGFNRVSVGVQSFNDQELKRLSRVHTAGEAAAFVQHLHDTGWRNISLDLMYGIPDQTPASWRQTLETAANLPVTHISMYGLKVEEGTALDRLIAQGHYSVPEDEATVALYFQALRTLERQGFERYEFSNLARPGFASRHNLNYWDNGEYRAFGPSAHGYVRGVRYENVRDLSAYLKDPLAGEQYPCPPKEALENAIIFGLRKTEGINVPAIERAYGIDFDRRYQAVLRRFLPEGHLIREGDRLRLSEAAIPVSNSILAEFLT